MPRLPDFTALGEPRIQPALAVASAQPVENNAASQAMVRAGAEMQDIAQRGGAEFEQAARHLEATNAKQDQMVAEDAINRLHAARVELESGKGGLKEAKGSAALGQQYLDTYQGKFDAVKDQISGTLVNENQRKLFSLRSSVPALQFRSALLGHQAVQTDHFNDQTETETLELAKVDAFANPLDPAATAAARDRINWALDQRAQRLGMPPEVAARVKAKYEASLNEDIASILVERNPSGALALIDRKLGIGGKSELTGVEPIDKTASDKLVALRHRALSYVTQSENRMRADAEKRMKEAQDTVTKAQEFALTGQMIDPQYAQQIKLMTAGTPFEPMANGLIEASTVGAMHGSLPLPAQEQQIRKIDAGITAQGSNPDQKKVVDQIRAITETQKREYKENPWAAAARFGRQPSVDPVQITDPKQVPQLVVQRLGAIAGVETYAGSAVSPLQPQEAKTFAEQLKALPPDQRAEVLAQTGQVLNAPRIAALAEQIDKHDRPLSLALKMGGDRTTAGRAASALVLRGAQALADKTVKQDDTALAGWRAEIAGYVRGTLGDDRVEQDVIEASYLIRAAQEQDGIAAPGFKGVGKGTKDAIAMVIGQPLERAGVKTFMPRGMNSEGEFDAKLRIYTAEKLREQAPSGQLYVRGQPVKVEQIANRLTSMGMKRDGQGRYIPVVSNALVTTDAQGTQLLRLDLR